MLRFEFSEIPDSGLQIEEELDKTALDSAVEAELFKAQQTAPLTLNVEKIDQNVRLSGKVQYAFSACCVSCLEEFPIKNSLDIEIMLAPIGDEQHDDLTIDEESGGFDHYDPDEPIDISKYILEAIDVSLPMHPRCSQACAGLCQICGANLNQQSCSCQPAADPRLAKLAELKL